MKLLLIDDEPALLYCRKKFLTERGCEVDTAKNAAEAVELLSREQYDGIILDVMLGETSGFHLCRQIKAITKTPVIFLSNLSDEESQAQGLLCGGDDYISKHCSLDLFWLKVQKRVEASSQGDRAAILDFSPLVIDRKRRKVKVQDQEVLLTNYEFEILVLMATVPLKVWSLGEIYRDIWGQKALNQAQTVQVHISRLRGKLEKAFPRHYFLQTVWGKGYQFIPVSLEPFSK